MEYGLCQARILQTQFQTLTNPWRKNSKKIKIPVTSVAEGQYSFRQNVIDTLKLYRQSHNGGQHLKPCTILTGIFSFKPRGENRVRGEYQLASLLNQLFINKSFLYPGDI